MDGETGGEFQDWEMLQNSDGTGSCDTNSSGSVEKMTGSDGIEGDSEGIVRTNYFSLDSQAKFVKIATDGDASSVVSDNPSWIDPGLENSYPRKESGDFWPDSGSDKSDDHKFSDLDAKDEFMFVQKAKSQVGFEGIGVEDEELRKLVEPVSIEFGDIDTHDSAMGIGADANSQEGPDLSAAEEQGMECSAAAEGLSMGAESAAGGAVKSGGQEEKRSAAWWKLPFELLKYCASRVSPTWTFSVAAAIMGCLILGRRLYKMKRKTQSLQLKVTMDDKKVSQFMSRAARLNEAFSVVKRVPVIRPSLPAAGVTPWPVMNLR